MDQTQTKPAQSRLLIATVLEPKDDLNENSDQNFDNYFDRCLRLPGLDMFYFTSLKLERCYAIINNIIIGKSEREANDSFITYMGKGPKQEEEVQLGLWYSILVDAKSANKWLKLLDNVRVQIIWFCRELIKSSVAGAESVCHSLLRQIAGGDITPKNIWLTETMLDLFFEHRAWLDKLPQLLATAVYTYLRVIVDHNGSMYSVLRQKEVEFCSSVLREKWTDCMVIGRDLVRLLQHVARINEFEKLWKDIMLNPATLSPTFTGLSQLLKVRTSRKFLISRLTPDMETKLLFLMRQVKFGAQKRYQDWFQRQYLATPESQSLRCDLIRYICAVFHPPNELLCSEIIPRWAVIGWLLTTCTSNVAASNAKLSLFYDWLFFDPERDSIMNIEPAILVMFHSIRPHPAITATLLDFLCRIMSHYCLPLKEQVKGGIYTALKTILDKRVLQTLSPLFDNSKLDKELRVLVREHFSEFCSQEEPNNKDVMELDNGNHVMDNNLSDAAFSKLRQDNKFQPIRDTRYQAVDIDEYLPQLAGDVREYTEQLQNEKDHEIQCEIMDRLLQTILQDDDYDQESVIPLATCLCQILDDEISSRIFPQELDEEFLCSMPEEDPSRQPILQLLGEMYNRQAKIGYLLLYFIKVSKSVNDEKMSTYKDFCKSLDGKDIESCLMSDLKACQDDDVRLFTYLLPDIYTQFPSIALGNSELLNLIVSAIDGTQLQELICQILQGHLIMFRKDSFLSLLNASLEWETLEQYFFWQLITAHNIPVEHIMPILPKLEFSSHAEALSSVMVLLKQEGPSSDLLRPLLCRDCKKNDLFTVSILKYWAQEYEDKLAELILSQVSKFNGTPKKRQRTGSTLKKESPSIEQILAHLDHMRQICRNISFLNNENIQHALQQIQQTASESLKTKFSDLLALAEDIEDMKTTRVLRGLPVRKAASASAAMGLDNRSHKYSKSKKLPHEDSDTESESSETNTTLEICKKTFPCNISTNDVKKRNLQSYIY
ncbi:hypothetical protein KUTeg_018369 [Tegillarca granosa]|uniref:SOSS complex subunit A homolog n=1 Tax=Tegillarca granosa TaxID=220873 RepID=A0ABQ9EK73_TEGGR|nr:hypothetical protein KUTeg_018369 [Tegillarca granosa]